MTQPDQTADHATADDFFAAAAPHGFPPEQVPDVLVNGKPVYVARMRSADVAAFWDEVKDCPETETQGAMAAYAIRSPDGKRLFQPSQRMALANVMAEKLVPVVDHFAKLNRIFKSQS